MRKVKLTTFGEYLRSLREENAMPLRKVAGELKIDPSLLGKIERNERQPTKEFMTLVAAYYNIDYKRLSNEFLSDQIAYKILEEEDIQILKIAEQKVMYFKKNKTKK